MTNPPMVYIQSDIPEGTTLSEWRASRVTPTPSILRRIAAMFRKV